MLHQLLISTWAQFKKFDFMVNFDKTGVSKFLQIKNFEAWHKNLIKKKRFVGFCLKATNLNVL